MTIKQRMAIAKVKVRNTMRRGLRAVCDFALADEPLPNQEEPVMVDEADIPLTDENSVEVTIKKKVITISRQAAATAVKAVLAVAVLALACRKFYNKGFRTGMKQENHTWEIWMSDAIRNKVTYFSDSINPDKTYIMTIKEAV